MNRLLVALALIYWSSAQVDGLFLYNLCENSTFTYKGIVVNSFLQRRFNISLDKVGYYAINDDELDLNGWFKDSKDRSDFQAAVDNYNEYLVDLYSEEFLNSEKINDIHLEKEKITAFKKQIDIVAEKTTNGNRNTINYYTQGPNRLNGLIDEIELYKSSTLSSSVWTKDSFKYYIDNLEIRPVETFAFKNDFLTKIYKKELKQFERFIFVSGSDKYYDLKNSYGIVEISVNLPFNTKELRESKCIDGQSLPPFFANKTES